ncbi:hypothetical protein HG531_002686 [Fusarium graminearum]|nr:hypothetical protein HG531_002686 [Fusarium graminearum]
MPFLKRLLIALILRRFKKFLDTGKFARSSKVLVAFSAAGYLAALIIINLAAAAHVVWTTEVADLYLPHVLLAHELVDLVVEVADLVVAEDGLLDAGHLARDLLEDLAAPFFAGGDGCDFGDELGTAGAAGVDDA